MLQTSDSERAVKNLVARDFRTSTVVNLETPALNAIERTRRFIEHSLALHESTPTDNWVAGPSKHCHSLNFYE